MDKNNAAKDRLLGYANPAYDQAAKRILANKKIMAYILKGTVREFAAASIDDIADKYIEEVLFKERQKSAQEKEQILSSEYAVDVTNDLAEEMRSMCNLSEGIYEEGLNSGMVLGMERGLEQGREQMIHSLAKEGLPLELIARVSGYSLAEVKRILGNN